MGYSTMLDVIASVLIGGLVLLILFRTNAGAAENSYDYGQDLIVQTNVTSLAETIEYDLKKVGYCTDYTKVANPTLSIVYADSTSIKFLSDTSKSNNPYWTGDGKIDTIYYYLDANSNAFKNSPNPNFKYLHRIINGNTAGATLWPVTQFSLLYFNSLGDTLSFPIQNFSLINSMQVTLQVQNDAPYNSNFQTAIWKQFTVISPNLSKR
jgi:hypothetical protein